MTDSQGPFAQAGMTYQSRGWGPFPLPPGKKFPPPKGWTGYLAPYPSGADIAEWTENGVGALNIGLRLPENVVGIDVDQYGNKVGGETFATALERLGPLPATIVSSSRPDKINGIRFFRVPPGRQWADKLGADVEIIHWGHRYAVVAPSIHPDTGDKYVWRDSLTWNVIAGPDVADLPYLPESWVTELDRGSVDDVSPKTTQTSEEAASWLAELEGGSPCQYLTRILDQAERQLAPSSSRHDTARKLVLRTVRAGEQGHKGCVVALDTLESMFLASFSASDRNVPPGEWPRMVQGAVGICVAKPTDERSRGCCEAMTIQPGIAKRDDEQFWQSREVLTHIHTAAQAAMVSPWAVLGVVLARCVAATPYTVVLPKTIAGFGSLNLFVALCGTSGSGKGGAVAVAEETINFGEIHSATVGSGEGIAHQYAKKTRDGVIRTNYECLMRVDEVDSMSALGMRQGSTLLPELRKAWMGEPLGFAYSDPAKRLPIKSHQYRMGLVMGIQPGRARPLLEDSDGGSPQRYVFLPTIDPTAPEQEPEAPEPIFWNRPTFIGKGGSDYGKCVVTLCESAVSAIKRDRRARNLGNETEFDGHSLFCRLKVAAALALLDGRTFLDELDWELSGTIMELSSATRDRLQSYLRDQAAEKAEGRAKGRAREAVIVAEELDTKAQARVNKAVKRRITDEWQTRSAISRSLTSRDRKLLPDALMALLEAGVIERQDNLDKPQFRLAPE